MPTYLDTSAVLRLVEQVGDWSLVEAGLREEPMSSELAELECWASVHKKWQDGEITRHQRDRLLGRVADHVLAATDLLALDAEVLAEAASVAGRFPVRTLDAIHVATAMLVDRRIRAHGLSLRFCTADRRQAAAAQGLLGPSAVDVVPAP